MGTGKSTVAKSLAEKAGKTFYDIDEMIVQSEGKNIFDIFSEKGEEYFRSVESRILNEVSQKTNSVIACGGGITLREENRKILKTNSLVVWLYSDVNICLNRIKSKQRPLLAFDNPYQIARKLMKERTNHYMQTSDLLINSEKNLTKIVDRYLKTKSLLNQKN